MTTNINRIIHLIVMLMITLPVTAQVSQNRSDDPESKKLQEIIENAWKEFRQLSDTEKKDRRIDHPNIKWARILSQYRLEHPENRQAAKATSEAIHLLFHANQFEEVRANLDSLNHKDPAWIYLGEVLIEDAIYRKDYKYLIDKAMFIQNHAGDDEIIRNITLTLGRAYRNNNNPDEAKSQFQSLITRYPNTPSAKEASTELLELQILNPGQHAPQFSTKTINGESVNSSKFKDKVVLLNFWLSSCSVCLEELPKLKKIYSTYNKQGFDILGISLDTESETLTKSSSKLNIPWQQIRDENIAKLFSVDSTPIYYLLDRDGKISAREKSIEKLSELITSLISKPATTITSVKTQSVTSFPSSSRDRNLKPDEVIKAINIQSGDVIADIGAGDGYFTRRFAVAAGTGGKAIALDVNPQMVLKTTADAKNYANYEARLVPFNDPMLDPNSVNIIFLCATYHEIENRIEYFTNVRKSLRKNGRLIIIDMDKHNAENKTHSIEKETVIRELETAGYQLIKESELLKPRHFFIEFKSKA